MSALPLNAHVPPQPTTVALRVPKPMKLYSRKTDQRGTNIHSTPPPTVHPVLFLESSPTCARTVENREMLTPVMLPPGRAKLATNPAPTGSPTETMTIGMLEVWRRIAATVGVAHATMTSKFPLTR